MESMIAKILHTLFQQITNGVTLIFAIGTLTGCFFILLKKRHHPRFYLCFWVLILFMVIWRAVIGIVSSRYAIMLVIPAVILTAFTGLRGESCWRLLCRKYQFLPRWFAKFISRAVLAGTSAGALLMAHHALSANQRLYKEVFKAVAGYKTISPGVVILTDKDECARTQYYSGIKTISFKSAKTKDILAKLKSKELRNKDVLVLLRTSEAKQLSIPARLLPRGKKLTLFKKISPYKKRKGINIYLYSSLAPEQMKKTNQ